MMALFVVLLMLCCLALGFLLGRMNVRAEVTVSPGAAFTATLAHGNRCRCASCWHGDFMCQEAQNASTVDIPASVLRREDREHPDQFAEAKLTEVCGSVRYTV